MRTQKVGIKNLPGLLLASAGMLAPAHLGAQQLGAQRLLAQQAAEPVTARAIAAEAFAKLPLGFESNTAQTAASIKFLSRGRGYTLFLTSGEAVLALGKSGQAKTGAVLHMKLLGGKAGAEATGSEMLPGTVNYFIGNDPKKWRTNVPTFGKVGFRDVYPGVDLIYYGKQQQLEYDLVVAPGAKPGVARLGISGASKIQLDSAGDLVLTTSAGAVRLRKPVAYQQTANGKKWVEARYKLRRAGQVAFEVGAYDRSVPLVIDPVLVYSSYLGGGANENFTLSPGYSGGIAVDSAGSAYVTGYTLTTGFPIDNPYQSSSAGNADIIVTKFKPDGSGLVYSTYLGGSGNDYGAGVAVDSSGNAYITGQTSSANFPTTAGAFRTSQPNANQAAIVAKLNPAGTALLYSTYLGGSRSDYATAIAVDSSGQASVTGSADSYDFPVTAGAPQTAASGNLNAGSDAFVTTLAASGASLVFSTYLGGTSNDVGNGIAVDFSGNVYVTGITRSTNFPTVNPLQASLRGAGDAFVAKLNPAASTLMYSTYLGGTANDVASGIAVDSFGNAYVVGYTGSTDFPTASPYQATLLGTPAGSGSGVFLSKLNPTGSALVYSTYLGGGGAGEASDFGYAIAVDSTGAAYVAGQSASGNLPMAGSLYANNRTDTPFLTKFNPAGSALDYSTYLGGQGASTAVAVDTLGDAYVTGDLNAAANFVTTPGAAQTTVPAGFAAVKFVVKIAPAPSVTALQSSVNPSVFGQQVTFTATVTAGAASTNAPTGTVVFEDGTTPVWIATLTNGTATYNTTGLNVSSHRITASYSGDSYFGESVSATLPQIVNMAATATTLTTSLTPATPGQTVTFAATVASVAPGAGAPTGSVTFKDGTTVLGTGMVSSGIATFGTAALTAGSHTVTASYGGDASFASGVSAALTETIAALPTLAITITEAIKVTDTPVLTAGPAPLAIAITEAIKVTDTLVLTAGPAPLAIAITEAIKVTDTPGLTEANTGLGNNIVFTPVDPATGLSPVTLTFATVTLAGLVNLSIGASGPPPPSGFQPGNPAMYYDLTTTAGFTGTITVCINYTGVSFQNPPALFHYENGAWVNRTTTVNASTSTVCGAVLSLSPFALFQQAAGPVVTTSFSTTPSGVNLQYAQGTLPSSFTQTFAVNSTPAGVPYAVVSSASWLIAPAGASTAVGYTVTLNPAGLAPGNYAATLYFSSANGSVQVPVGLTVLPPPALVSQPAAQLAGNFGTTPALQDIQLTSPGAGLAFNAVSNVPWLTINSSGGTTPATLHLQANPAGLPAAFYQGAITVTAPGAANSPYSIPVSFQVSGTGAAGQSAVDNSASFGPAVAAANTILTLFGPVGCSSNLRVLFNGAAPQILFANAGQINFVVPSGLLLLTGALAEVSCNGSIIETVAMQTAQADPAIFTQAGSGSGTGSIVNMEGTVNNAANPASRGSYISVYGTGFGTYNAPGPDGLRRLTNTVTAMIGGVVANVLYAGEAPTETSGLQQINILVPANTPVGPSVLIEISVAGANTQSGVTVAIQ